MITDLNNETIESFLKEHYDELVIVMFYGATCGPCKATMPHYETLATTHVEQRSNIKFARYHNWENDEYKKVSSQWEVSGVPGFRTFFQGRVITRREGGGDVEALQNYINSGMYIYNLMLDD
jgi:thiol-disulfide isomerase/thioredoxin